MCDVKRVSKVQRLCMFCCVTVCSMMSLCDNIKGYVAVCTYINVCMLYRYIVGVHRVN